MSFAAATMSPRTQDAEAHQQDEDAAAAPHEAAQQTEAPEDTKPISSYKWLQALIADGAYTVFSSHGEEPQQGNNLSTGLAADHLFLSLLEHHFIKDMTLLYNEGTKEVHNAMRLGMPVCGHPKIVHGGLTSAILDETFGALLFSMRKAGQAAFHRVFTARLEVDYLAPLPAESTIICTAGVESFEGRKLWLRATVAGPSGSGVVYARSKSLFVIPRGDPGCAPSGAAGAAEATNGH